MSKVTIMVGLSGSGKSAVANVLSEKNNSVILSSDNLRQELYNDVNDQEHNAEVFTELNRRLKKLLEEDRNVIVDATNLTIKSRKNILDTIKSVKNKNITVIAHVMTKPIEDCISDDSQRTKKVGAEVILKQVGKFQIPFLEEGFDEVMIHKFNNRKFITQSVFEDICYGMQGFDQKNHHHKYDLFDHSMLCYKTLISKIKDKMVCPPLVVASLLHDIGKMSTQKIKEDGNATYYSHENIGAYQLLDILRFYGDISNTLDTLFYINYHMLPFEWKTEKTNEKYKTLFGEEKYNYLKLLHECDKIACGMEE